MTESPPYPLLEPWGIITRCKHLRIVIAFQHKRIATIQGRFDMRGRATGIREHAQASPPVTEYELRRFLRVVRDRIRLDLDVFDHETLVTAYDVDPRQQLERSLDVAPGAVSQPYGDPQPARQSGNSANVITIASMVSASRPSRSRRMKTSFRVKPQSSSNRVLPDSTTRLLPCEPLPKQAKRMRNEIMEEHRKLYA